MEVVVAEVGGLHVRAMGGATRLQHAGFNAPELLEGGGSDDDSGDDVKEQMQRLRAARGAHRKQQREREVKAAAFLQEGQWQLVFVVTSRGLWGRRYKAGEFRPHALLGAIFR